MTRLPLALALVAGALALTPSAGSRTAATPEPATLLRQYVPVLLFHPDEHWAPETPETFLRTAAVERQVTAGRWTRVAGALPTSTAGCSTEPCFRLNLPCALKAGVACYEKTAVATDWQRPVIYGRVVSVPTGTPAPLGFTEAPRYLVRYWLFYEFDDWHGARKRLWQTHEGDWESISVGVSATGAPLLAAYSQHCSGTVRPWSAVTRRAGTHPVAYVALGSHANYFVQTSSSTRFLECVRKRLSSSTAAKATRLIQLAQDRVVDRTGSAHAAGPPDVPAVAPLQLIPLDPAATAWARFPGRWSEGQLLWVGSRPRSFTTVSQGAGPATPRWSSTSISSLWHTESS